MDLRVLLTTFGIIFLAEMGDKTQLAAMTMAAQTKKPGRYLSVRVWHSPLSRHWV
jgi:putative Ca2+/H+ antiporter (TMEM165/GDT1 family)